MNRKQFVLYEPGGRVARGFANGKLVEVRYVDVHRTAVASPDRDEFIQMVEQAQLSDEDLRECRIGYVDDEGVGNCRGWQEFLDMETEAT